MRRIFLSLAIVALAALMAFPPARAEDEASLADRLSRLERDVNFLQRQVYRNGAPVDNGTPDGQLPPGPAGASAEIRIAQINDEIRALRGQLEQAQYQARQTADELKKFETDVDYRLQAIEQKQAATTAAAAPVPAPVPAQGFAPNEGANPTGDPVVDAAAVATAKPGKDGAAATGKDFPDANAHYNYAFKLLNDKNYSAAAASFDAFVKKYPSDPLTGNAYYWLGESYYARGDYTRAAEGFRKGFEVNPDGQKAADNLLKLGLSLAQVKRVPEACIVLAQVSAKYGQTNSRTATRADAERTNLQCK